MKTEKKIERIAGAVMNLEASFIQHLVTDHGYTPVENDDGSITVTPPTPTPEVAPVTKPAPRQRRAKATA